jgi:hypothetical protein
VSYRGVRVCYICVLVCYTGVQVYYRRVLVSNRDVREVSTPLIVYIKNVTPL